MKHLFILGCCLFLLKGLAQKPEKIYGNARQCKPVSYYKDQCAAWKKVLTDHPDDANAWYNYYYANRVLLFNDTLDKRPATERTKAMEKIVDDMGHQVPNSYEYNLCRWMIGGFDRKQLPYLKKAAELGPDRTEHLDFMINMAEIDRNINDRNVYSKKKFAADQFSGGIVNYNYNVLVGLEPNALLITSGDNDTYPIWLLQAQGVRPDVTVLNLSLMYLEDYRNTLFSELGVEPWQSVADPEAGKTEADHERYRNGIIKHIAANKKNYPVYVSLTASGMKKFVDPIEQDLYLTGLAYVYSKKPVDNMALLKKNVEQLYALDYLDKTFYLDISPDMVKKINGNYLVPLLKLYDHYKLSGDVQKEAWLKAKLLVVSHETENEEEIKKRVARNN